MHFSESLYVPIIGSQGAGIETRAAHHHHQSALVRVILDIPGSPDRLTGS